MSSPDGPSPVPGAPADDATGASRALLDTLTPEVAATLVRAPRATVTPRHDARLGQRALAVLRTLAHDEAALVDEAPLGAGGMGVVRLARQVALDRRVAVKTLKPGRGSPHDVEALLAEAWLTGGLEHPNILPVYSLTLDGDGRPVLVMKRIEGVTWARLLTDPAAMAERLEGRAPLDEHLRILQQVCNAVHFAHARGVIHRDLKPENVMVGSFGEVYVVDWGIATAPGPASELAGTPAYLAPEMLGGAGAVLSPRTDVYLLGAVLFEVLAGRPPHAARSPAELVEAVRRSQPALPSDAPEELAALVRRCMSARPEERPQSALEVRRALEAFVAHQSSTALALTAEQRARELQALTAGATGERTRVDALFGEARFGLQQALVGWPENARARRVLDEVLEVMARYELRHGAPGVARSLVAEMTRAPADLREALAAALAREEATSAQLERLKDLEDALDPRTGAGSRTALAAVIGALWVLLPLVGHLFRDIAAPYELVASAPVALLSALVLVGAGALARRAPRAWTPLNRSLLRMVAFAMVAQGVGALVAWGAGFDAGRFGLSLLAGYWAFVSALLTVGVFSGLWPTAVAYTVGCALSALFPEQRYLIAVGPSLVMALNAASIARGPRCRRAAAPG